MAIMLAVALAPPRGSVQSQQAERLKFWLLFGEGESWTMSNDPAFPEAAQEIGISLINSEC